VPEPQGDEQEPPEWTYTALIKAILKAISEDDIDTEKALKAELMNKFRVPVGQVEADLLRHQMLQETAGEKKKAPPKSLDLDQVEGMDFLIDGHVPANDQTLLFGKAGTGKTTAAVGYARAVLFGEGFLDHPHPARRGSVLFIASDSGPGPLKTVLQSAGVIDHPVFKNGAEKRFHLWASDRNQGMSAWVADLRGCMRLLEFIKEEGIDLLIIDSCKSVTAPSDINYCDNKQVGSLLTYFKEVICAHTSVVWLSHDGTQGPDTSSGAKAWKEVPSMVHRLEYDIDPKTKEVAKDYRRWVVQKNRLGRCREFYFEEHSGDVKLRDKQEVFPNCTAAIVEVLMACFLEGQTEVSRGQIVSSVDATGKTVDNCLSKAVKAKHPEICRCNRGKYKLAPRLQEALKDVRVDREEVSEKPLSDCDVSTSRQFPDGKSGSSEFFPRENVGKSPNTNGCNGSGAGSSRRGEFVYGELEDGCSLVELKRIGSSYDVEAG
jgi:archaellum biogenesis ATPase FlaH